MSGLIVAGRESRKVTATATFEASVVGLHGHEKIERVRFADGHWRKASLLLQRLEALGISVDLSTLKIQGRGDHTPTY